jgi:hypothetical protein
MMRPSFAMHHSLQRLPFNISHLSFRPRPAARRPTFADMGVVHHVMNAVDIMHHVLYT